MAFQSEVLPRRAFTRVVADAMGNTPEQYATTRPFVHLPDLRENGNLKTSILAEVEVVAGTGPTAEMIIAVIPIARQFLCGLSSVMTGICEHNREREDTALGLIHAAFYHYSEWFTKNSWVGMTIAPEPNPHGMTIYFGAVRISTRRVCAKLTETLRSYP